MKIVMYTDVVLASLTGRQDV